MIIRFTMKSAIIAVISLIFIGEFHHCKVDASASSTRFLRSKAIDDERMFQSPMLDQLSPKLSSSVTNLESLTIPENFESLLAFIENTDKTSSHSIFSLLPKETSNMDIVKTIYSLKRVNSYYSTRLEAELIRHWVVSQKSIEEIVHEFSSVFGANLFLSKRPLNTLVNYVQEFEKVNGQANLYRLLKPNYKIEVLLASVLKGIPEADETTQSTLYNLMRSVMSDPDEHSLSHSLILKEVKTKKDVLDETFARPWVIYMRELIKQDQTNLRETSKQDTSIYETIIEQIVKDFGYYFTVDVPYFVERSGEPDAYTIAEQLWKPVLERIGHKPSFFLVGRRPSDAHLWLLYVKDSITKPEDLMKPIDEVHSPALTLAYKVEILYEATSVPELKGFAEELLEKKFDEYLKTEPTPSYLMISLLDFNRYTLLKDPYFLKWLEYAKGYYKGNEYNKYEWMTDLQLKYGYGTSVNIFIEGLQDVTTKNEAESLIQSWIRVCLLKGRSVSTVFDDLAFKDVDGNLLADPKFKIWLSYIEQGKDDITVSLEKQFARDEILRMVDIGLADDTSKQLAEELQKELFNGWKARKDNPKRV